MKHTSKGWQYKQTQSYKISLTERVCSIANIAGKGRRNIKEMEDREGRFEEWGGWTRMAICQKERNYMELERKKERNERI